MDFFKKSEAFFALKAVREACLIAERIAAQMAHGARDKADRSPVTVADFAVQALISERLEKAFPQDCLVGEESSDALREPAEAAMLDQITVFAGQAVAGLQNQETLRLIDRGKGKPCGRFWTLDPIDGTKGFLRGEQYAVALALLDCGRPVFSVLGCPRLGADGSFQKNGPGVMTVAFAGGGAWLSPLDQEKFTRMHVSKRSALADLHVLRSVEASHANADHLAPVFARYGIAAKPMLMDSQAKYAVVAAGVADLFFYLVSKRNPAHRMKIWDVAPGALVVEEAGGKITDLQGGALDYTCGDTLAKNPGLVITNGLYHDQSLEILREAEKSRP